ncbi:MAG: RelA/SpoT domain-containing protein [Acidobacteriota bacterium]
MPISKTQIDRLGDRLKSGDLTESDLRLLDDYRRSFGEAYEAVVEKIVRRGQAPTGRLAKSTLSIVDKLRRESIRLSQMQDIAGCRVIVADIAEQEDYVPALAADFPGAVIIDRRDKPSHGYRAIHVIVEMSDKPIEIQVRTLLQHGWAEVSEKASDIIDPTIKYGGGSSLWQKFLEASSKSIAAFEALEKSYSKRLALLKQYSHDPTKEMLKVLERSKLETEQLRTDLVRSRNETQSLLTRAISHLDELKRTTQ